MDDGISDDVVSQYVPLGSVFIAIAIIIWTSVAVWLCYTGPRGSEAEDTAMDGSRSGLDFADTSLLKAASGFADILLEGKDKGSNDTSLELARLEEFLSSPSQGDCKGGSLNQCVRGLLGKLATSASKEGQLSPLLAGLQLEKESNGKTKSSEHRSSTASSASRASLDQEGLEGSGLANFHEHLRDKLLTASLGGIGRKGVNDFNHVSSLAAPSRSRVSVQKADTGKLDMSKAEADSSCDRWDKKGASGMKKEVVEDFLKQLLHPPGLGLKGKLAEASEGDDKESSVRPATMLSMAEHAREIGNKYLQERHFAAASHCYEVACLLCPATPSGAATSGSSSRSGTSGSGNTAAAAASSASHNACTRHLAAYHCNCSLACLELGRYGDAINEAHAALVLSPPRHLAVKAHYRLAVAHANLKNFFEARRCLKRCLDLDPLNEYARAFLRRLGEEDGGEETIEDAVAVVAPRQLVWVEPPKRVQSLPSASRDKAKWRKGKQKSAVDENAAGTAGLDPRGSGQGAKEAPGVRLDREAGLWHSVARHGNKLYILGGARQTSGEEGSGAAANANAGVRGSDELHVLDVDSFECRQLNSATSKPPHPCYCHSATVVGSSMIVFGGCGPPLEQPPLVMILDLIQGKWRVPTLSGIPPRQRQGHSANVVQGERMLCIFGGIEPTGERRVARVYNDAHLLDIQSFTWRKLEASGHRPHARFGHSATNLPGNPGRLLIVGGRDHLGSGADPALSSAFTGLHILDTDRRAWTQQHFSGVPPLQAFYHSACVIDDSTILFLGSGTSISSSLPVHLLNVETWHWSTPAVSGLGPSPRIGHVAVSIGSRVYIYGGISMRESSATMDKTVYVLETGQPALQAPAQVQSQQQQQPMSQTQLQQQASNQSGQQPQPMSQQHEQQQSLQQHASHQSQQQQQQQQQQLLQHQQQASSQQQLHLQQSSQQELQQQLLQQQQHAGGSLSGDLQEAMGERISKDDFDEVLDDEPELSFEELLEQEKAYFKKQSEKPHFPRAKEAKEKESKKGRS